MDKAIIRKVMKTKKNRVMTTIDVDIWHLDYTMPFMEMLKWLESYPGIRKRNIGGSILHIIVPNVIAEEVINRITEILTSLEEDKHGY